jgi:hypothetical protein
MQRKRQRLAVKNKAVKAVKLFKNVTTDRCGCLVFGWVFAFGQKLKSKKIECQHFESLKKSVILSLAIRI